MTRNMERPRSPWVVLPGYFICDSEVLNIFTRFPKSFSISGIQKCFTPKKTYLFLIMVTWNDDSEVLVYKSLQFRALPWFQSVTLIKSYSIYDIESLKSKYENSPHWLKTWLQKTPDLISILRAPKSKSEFDFAPKCASLYILIWSLW